MNKNENSHLINVPQGQSIADTLITTHIFHSSGLNMGSGFAAAAAAPSGAPHKGHTASRRAYRRASTQPPVDVRAAQASRADKVG